MQVGPDFFTLLGQGSDNGLALQMAVLKLSDDHRIELTTTVSLLSALTGVDI